VKQFKKAILCTCLITAISITAGCSSIRTDVPKEPNQVGSSQTTVSEMQDKLKALLPVGAELIKLSDSAENSGMLKINVDEDAQEEWIAAYKTPDIQDKVYVAVFKQKDAEWVKLLDISSPGHTIDYINTAKILGDGQKQLLVGWAIGASAGNLLEGYEIKDSKAEKLFEKMYHKLEVADLAGAAETGDKEELAVWTKDSGDAFAVDVYRWYEGSLVQAGDTYEKYFEKVVSYYKERLEKQPDSAIYWYYLADAQFKMRKPEDALKSIEEGLKLNSEYPGNGKFKELKETIQHGC